MSTLAEALAPKSDQLNAVDLVSGPRVLKITKARISKEDRATKIVLNFEGDNGKPWKPCKTMGRAMVMAWGVTDENQFVGKSVRVYRDPTVTFGPEGEVGGIRISHLSHIDKPSTAKLMVSKGKYALFTFHPLVTEAESQPTTNSQPDPAVEKWANDHIAFVVGAVDRERLASVQAGGKKRFDWLAGVNPDLHAKVQAAYDKRFAELSGADMPDEDPFGLPPIDGRTDEQHGEAFPHDTNEQED